MNAFWHDHFHLLEAAEAPAAPRLNEGRKADASKPRMDLLPPDALREIAQVLTKGAKKYGDRNWEKGMDWGRLIGAAYRHLSAFQSGEDFDDETGLPHLAHLACCTMFLLSYQMRGAGRDDRHRLIDDDDEPHQMREYAPLRPAR